MVSRRHMLFITLSHRIWVFSRPNMLLRHSLLTQYVLIQSGHTNCGKKGVLKQFCLGGLMVNANLSDWLYKPIIMETIFVYACISLKKKIIEYWYYQFFFSFLSIHYVPSAYLYPTRGKFSNCVTKIAMAYNNGKSCIFSNCLSTAQIKQHLKNRLFETTNTLFISNQNLKMVSDNQWIVWNKTIISLFQTVYWLFQTMFLKCGFTTVSHMVWTTRFFPELWMLSSPLRRREWKGAEDLDIQLFDEETSQMPQLM